jgi:prepilin-type N-terminal cleavage/methylation domain-containing protein
LTTTLRNNQRGFTLIEVIVAIAVVAILAGIITPSVIKHLDDSKRARAQNDCLVIGSAIASFYKDTGRMPTLTLTAATAMLVSEGNLPASGQGATTNGWRTATTAANVDLFINHLAQNNPKGLTATVYPDPASAPGNEFVWRGPYQTSFPADPWGNRYAVNLGTNSNAVWVLSAGPDGKIDTPFAPPQAAAGATITTEGDDIAYRMK